MECFVAEEHEFGLGELCLVVHDSRLSHPTCQAFWNKKTCNGCTVLQSFSCSGAEYILKCDNLQDSLAVHKDTFCDPQKHLVYFDQNTPRARGGGYNGGSSTSYLPHRESSNTIGNAIGNFLEQVLAFLALVFYCRCRYRRCFQACASPTATTAPTNTPILRPYGTQENGNWQGGRQQQQNRQASNTNHPSGRMHVPANDGVPPAKPYIIDDLANRQLDAQDLAVWPSCPICNFDFSVKETVKRLPCGHVFHQECMETWLFERCTCPICRWEFPTDDQDYEPGRTQRMKARVPRYYKFELDRASVKELKAMLKKFDKYRPVERHDLIRHLVESGTIELISCQEEMANDGNESTRYCDSV